MKLNNKPMIVKNKEQMKPKYLIKLVFVPKKSITLVHIKRFNTRNLNYDYNLEEEKDNNLQCME